LQKRQWSFLRDGDTHANSYSYTDANTGTHARCSAGPKSN